MPGNPQHWQECRRLLQTRVARRAAGRLDPFDGGSMRTFLLLGAVLAFVPGTRLVADDPSDKGAARIEALIKQLSDDSFVKREAASKALEKIGKPALAALRKAAEDSNDLEVRDRASK